MEVPQPNQRPSFCGPSGLALQYTNEQQQVPTSLKRFWQASLPRAPTSNFQGTQDRTQNAMLLLQTMLEKANETGERRPNVGSNEMNANNLLYLVRASE